MAYAVAGGGIYMHVKYASRRRSVAPQAIAQPAWLVAEAADHRRIDRAIESAPTGRNSGRRPAAIGIAYITESRPVANCRERDSDSRAEALNTESMSSTSAVVYRAARAWRIEVLRRAWRVAEQPDPRGIRHRIYTARLEPLGKIVASKKQATLSENPA